MRPAPVGLVVNNGILQHGIRAYYLGWASNGHIGRVTSVTKLGTLDKYIGDAIMFLLNLK